MMWEVDQRGRWSRRRISYSMLYCCIIWYICDVIKKNMISYLINKSKNCECVLGVVYIVLSVVCCKLSWTGKLQKKRREVWYVIYIKVEREIWSLYDYFGWDLWEELWKRIYIKNMRIWQFIWLSFKIWTNTF